MNGLEPTTTDVTGPPVAPDAELCFQQEMFREFEAKNAHSFILYFNVHDFVFTQTLAADEAYRPLRLSDYLGLLLRSRGFNVVMTYSLTGGLSFLDDTTMRDLLLKQIPERVRRVERQYGQTCDQDTMPPLAESQVALSYLYRLLTYEPTDFYPADDNQSTNDLRIAVILEYLEAIAPHEDSRHVGPEANFNIQILHRLALDRRLGGRHIIIGLAADLGHVASSLHKAGSECRAFRVDLPVEDLQPPGAEVHVRRERSDWLQWMIQRTLPALDLVNPLDLSGSIGGIEDLAGQTTGFSFDSLRDLVYYSAKGEEALTNEMVQQRKRAVISAESRDLLEFVEPKYGFDAVAGYDYVKKHLTTVLKAIKRQASDPSARAVVPKGILMLGPPGTGKSFIASTLAKETRFNMVKFKNIRSMWVGETERNLNRVLDLISAMHPVIVFVDEVDAALGQRGGGAGGAAGGVEQRIFQRILEFMAMDENRGKVLWIAASNRPDLVDAALVSRFDLVIPLLLPDDEARLAMLSDSFPDRIGYELVVETEGDLQECVEITDGFSGRELDTVCRRALQISGEEKMGSEPGEAGEEGALPLVSAEHIYDALKDFRQARDPAMHELQMMLAIQATNFCAFLPDKKHMPAHILTDKSDRDPIDADKLSSYILELWNRVRATRWRD